jgi:hypothetical protein
MPFKSKSQERAAFSGALGPVMKAHAKEWASKTKQSDLPNYVDGRKKNARRLGIKKPR